MILISNELNFSPGSGLLQRSEIVAMMNTLYRFSESLHAVDKFREMWRQLEPRESTKIAEKVEESTAAKVRSCLNYTALTSSQRDAFQAHPSPAVHEELPPLSVFEDVQRRLKSLFRVCKDSTVDCISIFSALFWRAVKAVSALFKPSGKEHGPGGFRNEF